MYRRRQKHGGQTLQMHVWRWNWTLAYPSRWWVPYRELLPGPASINFGAAQSCHCRGVRQVHLWNAHQQRCLWSYLSNQANGCLKPWSWRFYQRVGTSKRCSYTLDSFEASSWHRGPQHHFESSWLARIDLSKTWLLGIPAWFGAARKNCAKP